MWTLKQFEFVNDRFQSSGLSVKYFCQNEYILQSKFYYWNKRLREHNKHREQPSDSFPIVFSELNRQLPAKKRVQQKQNTEHLDPASSDVLEIVYRNGVKLCVSVGADINQLRSLILLTQ